MMHKCGITVLSPKKLASPECRESFNSIFGFLFFSKKFYFDHRIKGGSVQGE